MTEIQSFYNGKIVLITGATGFLGKALLEKLLRSTEVKRIYVLIREKSQMTIHHRLQDLLKQSIFEELTRKSDKDTELLLAKVVPLSGDCGLPDLGLSTSDRDLLSQNVNVVFHCAATVRFTEPLRVAARINVVAAQDLLKVARRMEHLEAFVHVSTAYVGCTQTNIDEGVIVVPKAEIDGGNAVAVLRSILQMDDQKLATLTPRILGKYPNTYTFTKTLAEEVLASEVGDLPLAIFRPGIVLSSYAEPHPGWVENAFGIPYVMMSLILGLVHTIKCSKTATMAAVPIDYCVNAMIACGFRTAHEKNSILSSNSFREPPVVYNCVAEESNPIKWKELFEWTIDLAKKQPTRHLMWYPFLWLTDLHLVQRVLWFILHTIPVMTHDLVSSFNTKQNKFHPIIRRLHKLIDVADYFVMRSWNVSTGNLHHLWASLDEDDQNMFPFDMLQVDWKKHNYHSVMGVRRKLLNEDPATMDEDREHYQILRIVHYFTILMIVGFLMIATRWLISLSEPRWLPFEGLIEPTGNRTCMSS